VTIVEGGCDLLLCYHHPRQPVQLDASRYDMLTMGTETLRPYSRCDRNGKPDYVFPGSAKAPVPFLSYTSNAYLGRMVELMMADTKRPLHLMKHYETDMSESLKMMALEGHGVAFLPESSVLREVRNRQLARTDGPTGGVGSRNGNPPLSRASDRPAHRQGTGGAALGIPGGAGCAAARKGRAQRTRGASQDAWRKKSANC
jgi:DNA-binding transcriptional LysR family regulator